MRGSVFVMGEQETERPNLTHCWRCAKKFKKGDKIFCKNTNTSKRYHFQCAEKSNLTSEIS